MFSPEVFSFNNFFIEAQNLCLTQTQSFSDIKQQLGENTCSIPRQKQALPDARKTRREYKLKKKRSSKQHDGQIPKVRIWNVVLTALVEVRSTF